MKKQFAIHIVIALSILTLSARQTNAQAPTCAGIHTTADCPDTGCGGPGADAPLNQKKNRTQDASNPERVTLGAIRRLRQPQTWQVGQDRATLASNENRAVAVMGYLSRASVSGKESTNCNLLGPANNDNHLDLISKPGDPGASAVTAEITPRVRREGWDIRKLQYLAKVQMFVRATGWLTLDTQHIARPLVRATNWEVHPVTDFDVCTGGIRQCQQGNNWTPLADWHIPRKSRSARRVRSHR